MKNIYITLSFILVMINSQAQNNTTKAADKLFDRFEYVNATRAYLKLTDTGKADNYVYKRLGDCYYNVFNSVEAEKWYAKAIEKEQDAETYFRYAQMLKANSKYDASTTQMKKFAALAPNDKRAKNVENEKNYLNTLLGNSKLFDVSLAGINSKNSDFGAYLKNNIVYFASARNSARKNYDWNNQPFLDLYQTDYVDGKINGQAVPVTSLNTKHHEGPLCISADGNTAYFSRESFFENEFEKTKDKKNKLGKMFIYKAINDNGKWIDISSVALNNKLYNTSSPSLSKDGKTLYFISDRPGSMGKTDVWKAAVNADGSFGEPQNLGPNVNTEGNELSAFIADDNTLYFASNGRQGLGGLDIFAFDTNKNSEALNLGKPVNSEKDDFGFTFNQSQNVAFLSSNRSGGTGDDDIYIATPVCNLDLIVRVRDANSGTMIADATVSMLDEKLKTTGKTMTNGEGVSKFTGECDKSYSLNIEKLGYDTQSVGVAKGKGNAEVIVNLVPTKAIVTEKEVILNEIRFDYDKSNITQEGAFELDKLVAVMIEYPNMVIYAKSHTDSRGKDAYNMSLSDRRAQSTVQYVLSKGIAADRITGKGMGESEPKVNCGEGCTEEQHAENRRSEFLIIKK